MSGGQPSGWQLDVSVCTDELPVSSTLSWLVFASSKPMRHVVRFHVMPCTGPWSCAKWKLPWRGATSYLAREGESGASASSPTPPTAPARPEVSYTTYSSKKLASHVTFPFGLSSSSAQSSSTSCAPST